MSKIGKKLIEIPDGTTAVIDGDLIKVKGPKGELEYKIPRELKVTLMENKIAVLPISKSKKTPALWGTIGAIIANMVSGVTNGFEKKLELVGVGYRAKMNGKDLGLTVGYSHPVEFVTPAGIEIAVTDNQFVRSADIVR